MNIRQALDFERDSSVSKRSVCCGLWCVAVVGYARITHQLSWLGARVAKLVDAAGLKPAAHPEGSVRVRVPSRAPRATEERLEWMTE